jgi:hypothetical protein
MMMDIVHQSGIACVLHEKEWYKILIIVILSSMYPIKMLTWLWLTGSLLQYNVEESWCSEAAWGSDGLTEWSQTFSLSVPTSSGKFKTPAKQWNLVGHTYLKSYCNKNYRSILVIIQLGCILLEMVVINFIAEIYTAS